jgi:hypothetical protein
MGMKTIVMKQNRVIKKRNPIAKALKFFTPKIIKDKTKYNRKQDDQIWKRYFWKGF